MNVFDYAFIILVTGFVVGLLSAIIPEQIVKAIERYKDRQRVLIMKDLDQVTKGITNTMKELLANKKED